MGWERRAADVRTPSVADINHAVLCVPLTELRLFAAWHTERPLFHAPGVSTHTGVDVDHLMFGGALLDHRDGLGVEATANCLRWHTLNEMAERID